jgi:hypothetical protein
MILLVGRKGKKGVGDLAESITFHFLLLKKDLMHIWQNANICLILMMGT